MPLVLSDKNLPMLIVVSIAVTIDPFFYPHA